MRERLVKSITDFGGVDLTNPVLQVDDSRAIDISNMVKMYRNGETANQKRSGWEQISEAPSLTYYKLDGTTIKTIVNPTQINCLTSFYAEDGKTHVIAHIGYCLFEISNLTDYTKLGFTPLVKSFTYNNVSYVTCDELVNDQTEMFVGGNRLYILGGNKYLCLRFYLEDDESNYEIFEVEDSDKTYIPVTTNLITCVDSPVSSRVALDDVNLLHSKRRNKCVSGTLLNRDDITRTTKYYEYQLDTNINFKDTQSTEDITVKLEYR